ncbi:hypothetical protein ACFOY2_01320 [Nonomuraea purpurea]|uniref:DUF4260 family protein n=1 Tax=Nonomuraea purpurea TaxID=1849276 RepID=A0ABV8G004_9ACTN
MATEHVNDAPRPVQEGRRPQRVGWGALTLFLAAFAVFESVKYGLPTTAAALVFFALPDAARLAGVRPPGWLHQAVHRVWIPLAVLVVYSFGVYPWPPLFTAGLGWLTRIGVERTLGRRPAARS